MSSKDEKIFEKLRDKFLKIWNKDREIMMIVCFDKQNY
jgi:hypothetical protein